MTSVTDGTPRTSKSKPKRGVFGHFDQQSSIAGWMEAESFQASTLGVCRLFDNSVDMKKEKRGRRNSGDLAETQGYKETSAVLFPVLSFAMSVMALA